MSEDLREFIDNVAKESHLRVEADLGGGFVRLRTEEAERRQARHDIRSSEDALIELLRNSRDAGARTIFVALSRSGAERRIVVVDDGCGVPPALHEAVFEARVTSKLDTVHTDLWGVHGRGMALFSIRLNAEEAFIAASDVGEGLRPLSSARTRGAFPRRPTSRACRSCRTTTTATSSFAARAT